jgi:hypothetical protein
MRQIKGPVGRFADNWVKACKDKARFDGIGARALDVMVGLIVILSRTAGQRLNSH